MKLQNPVVETSVYCHASYTSPAGRSYYDKDHLYSQSQVISYLNQAKANRAEAEKIEQEKIARKNALISKEERLRMKERELKTKEKQLAHIEKREQELMWKEKEFIKATKGHIYSAEEKPSESDDFASLSPYEQLKRLKQLLDNGDINFDEYSQKRKEIAG